MKNLKTPLIVATILFALFLFIIIFHRLTSEDKTLKKSLEINLYINDVVDYRGFLWLNDSIVISKNCPNIKIPNNTIGNITAPFQIIKKRNNDTIKIVQNYNTSYFLLIE
ncbi:hypothetical protein [Marixanthomonas ophiurae]|uniref:Uncharacterized protein n=1 Tax=Marixanthomonas ophiurae TaxID=387659 RepID=A0A3E1QC72_9FLAO|nr:hypothetical protein [Marixanthomonas ophiurae]RFN59737.1 hypothetical protein DZ858_06700 [Marixanthomonas ophiurae]